MVLVMRRRHPARNVERQRANRSYRLTGTLTQRKKRSTDPKRRAKPANASAFGPYANSVAVQLGISETVIAFARIYPNGVGWPVEDVARVTLPLVVAKALIFQLTNNVAMIESVAGPIYVPPGMVPQIPQAQLMKADLVARLAILHAELFPSPRRRKPRLRPWK